MSHQLSETQAVEPTPMTLIQAALESGCDTERLEKLMELQERWNAGEERKESRAAELSYNKAMSECQSAIQPVVAKLRNTQTNSLYADLVAVDEAIRPHYTHYGFSLSAGTEKSSKENNVHVYIDVLHKAGHCRRYGDDFPLDDAGIKGTVNKTQIQAHASTTSYARRYIEMGIFNVTVTRLDQDGNVPVRCINESQVAKLNTIMETIHPDDDAMGALLRWAGIDSLDKLPADRFRTAKQTLEAKAAKYQ